MRLGEVDAALDKPVDVRRLRLRVTAENAEVVVEVVADNQQDVGFGVRFCLADRRSDRNDQK